MAQVYIAAEENPMTATDIQKGLESSKMEDKVKALKSLVINIINDEQAPRMIMNVINTLVPIQNESHDLKKILLFYWEVIEKVQANGNLKDEMILVCNSLRNDLLHPNEYIRGRTLKLLSRIQHRGILEPLQSAILENVQHKHIYVRRNCAVLLYEIYLNFGDDLISDLDEYMEKLLLSESDLSTKRNAFLLLFHANQAKAMEYLNNTLTDDQGDIMYLAILELFRKVCKLDQTQKPKLMRQILQFTKSKSASVLYECANTLVAISPTTNSLKQAVSIYMQLLTSQTDNNVKLVILDRLEQINPKFLEDKIMDLSHLLTQQSLDIRKKVLRLVQTMVKQESAQQIALVISKELKKMQSDNDNATRLNLLQTLLQFVSNFRQVHQIVGGCIIETILTNLHIDDHCAYVANQIIQKVMPQDQLKKAFLKRFYDIQNLTVFKSGLWVLGEYCQEEAMAAFNEIKKAIGSLPFETNTAQQIEEGNQQTKKLKTIILEDGTYGTISETQSNEKWSKFRELLMSNSFLASSLVRTFIRLLKHVEAKFFNKYASQALLIFCGLIRYYQNNIVQKSFATILKGKVDQESIEKLHQAIQVLISGNRDALDAYIEANSQFKEQQQVVMNADFKLPYEDLEVVQRQPDDSISMRLLKKGGMNEIDLGDEENFGVVQSNKQDDQFVQRLNHIVQLTGYSDPVYGEAFVQIHKYDITFEVLLINRSSKMVQNVQVEFRTSGDSKTIEKAQGVTLQPNQSAKVKTSIKFSSSDVGVVYGSIHFENNAGVEQPYLVTKEIPIDLMNFIYPADIEIEEFRKKWAKYEWENRISINTNMVDTMQFVKLIQKEMKLKLLQEQQTQYVCANLYAKTKLEDDFLVNISGDNTEGKIQGYIRIRSRVKGIVVNLGDRIKLLQNRTD